jgi:raffinose/stachyose/melibiose transport system substrate-binding protein
MRRWLPIAVFVVAATAACTTPGTDSGANSIDPTEPVNTDISDLPDTTLSIWTSESGTRLDILKQLGKEFEAANPNVKLEWTVRDFGSYPAQIKLALSSDDGPDVAIGNLGWSLDGPLIKAGLFRPLDDYAKAYGWDTRYPEVGLRQLKFTDDGKTYGEGSIWGAPYAADVIGWFYNKDLLDQLGMEPPKTMDDLEAILAASKAAGQQPIVFGNKDGWPAWHLAYNLIDQYATEDVVTGIVYNDEGATWENDDIKAGLDKMLDWEHKGYFSSDINAIAQDDATADFVKGKGLFFPGGSWYASSMPDNFGFFLAPPLEAGTPARATGSFGYAWHVAANSDKVPQSAAFIDFTSDEHAAQEFFKAGDIAPLQVDNPDIKQGDVYQDIYNAWTSVLDNNTLLPYLDFSTPTGSEVSYPVLQKILAGQESVDDGLADIEADREAFVAENQ